MIVLGHTIRLKIEILEYLNKNRLKNEDLSLFFITLTYYL